MSRLVLGVDPGFAAVGWAVVDVATVPTVIRAGVVETEKSNARRKIAQADDNTRRIREIVLALDQYAFEAGRRTLPIHAVCAESNAGHRNATVAAKVASAWGGVVALAALRRLPIVQLSPTELKERVAGSKTAPKEAVADAVRGASPSAYAAVSPLPEKLQNHAYDAVAAVLGCLETDIIRAIRRPR